MAAANQNPMHPSSTVNPVLEIPVSDTTVKTYCTAGANGYLVEDIIVVNKDAVNARIIELYLNNGSTDFLIGSANIPANAGVSGNPSVKLLSVLGVSMYTLAANYLLKVKAPVALTSVIQLTPYRIYDYVAL